MRATCVRSSLEKVKIKDSRAPLTNYWEAHARRHTPTHTQTQSHANTLSWRTRTLIRHGKWHYYELRAKFVFLQYAILMGVPCSWKCCNLYVNNDVRRVHKGAHTHTTMCVCLWDGGILDTHTHTAEVTKRSYNTFLCRLLSGHTPFGRTKWMHTRGKCTA